MNKRYLTDYFGTVNFFIVRSERNNKLHFGIHNDFETACDVANKVGGFLLINNFSFFDEFGNLYVRGIAVKTKDIDYFHKDADYRLHYLKSDIYEEPLFGFENHIISETSQTYSLKDVFSGTKHTVLLFNYFSDILFYLCDLNTNNVCNNCFKNYTLTLSTVAQNEEFEHNLFKQRNDYALTEVGSAISPDKQFIHSLTSNGKFK